MNCSNYSFFTRLLHQNKVLLLKKFIEVWCQRIANLVCTVFMAIKRSVSIWKQADGCISQPLASGWQLVDTIHCKKNNTNKITSFTFRLLWNRQNMQYADERTARLNDACEGCTAETSFWNAWPWDGIWMFYFSLLRLWYLWIYLLNKMKISELWLTAQTQNEMVFSELNKVIQKVFLIISCSYQYFCILAFQFQRRDDYQWNTSHIFLYIRFAMHYFIMRFQKSGTTTSW